MLVVEILNNKSTYNTLELTSGRMAKLAKGDVIVGALGHRQALFGYSGHLPETVKAGDVIQVLNIGGVLGICDSVNPEKGRPFDAACSACVLQFPYLGERIGVPARVGYQRLDYNATVEHARRAGRRARRHLHGSGQDRRRLRDRRAHAPSRARTCTRSRRRASRCVATSSRWKTPARAAAMIFTDLGVVTTTAKTGPALTRTMLTEMTQGEPDVIVFELGDGILGAYGVEAILSSPDIKRRAVRRVVLSANDPVAAWGGVKLLREQFGIEPCGRHGSRDRQRGRREHHPRADRRAGVQRDHRRRGARRLHHRRARS